MDKGRRWQKGVRRGAAAALALVGVWGLTLTADPSGAARTLTDLWSAPAFAVETLSRQLASLPDGETLSPWGELLLSQSSLLQGGRGAAAVEDGWDDEPVDPGDDDQSEPPLSPSQDQENVVEHTAQAKEGYLQAGEVSLKNSSNQEVDLEAIVEQAGQLTLPMGDGPQILILHSHGSEAYTQSGSDTYRESDPYRTTDCTQNVVRVGEEIAAVLRDHGFRVLHDTTLFDYPSYNDAYTRARTAVEDWLAQYPTISLILDVHRDALVGADGQAYKLVSQEGEEKVAQVMLVVGSDSEGLPFPNWRENLTLAARLQQDLAAQYQALARPITLRASRYNQDLSPGALLVEVGSHGNTLQEALAGARLWAETVAGTLTQLSGGEE